MPFMQIKNKIKMGLKKGRGLFSQSSAVGTSLKSLREKIIKEKGADSDYRPYIAIDGVIINIPLLVVRIPILKGTIM